MFYVSAIEDVWPLICSLEDNSRGNHYQCPNCSRTYKHRYILNKHMTYSCTMKSPLGLRCSVCNRNYKMMSSLTKHVKYECGKDPQFQCPHCQYRSKRKDNLRTHIANVHKVSLNNTNGKKV